MIRRIRPPFRPTLSRRFVTTILFSGLEQAPVSIVSIADRTVFSDLSGMTPIRTVYPVITSRRCWSMASTSGSGQAADWLAGMASPLTSFDPNPTARASFPLPVFKPCISINNTKYGWVFHKVLCRVTIPYRVQCKILPGHLRDILCSASLRTPKASCGSALRDKDYSAGRTEC